MRDDAFFFSFFFLERNKKKERNKFIPFESKLAVWLWEAILTDMCDVQRMKPPEFADRMTFSLLPLEG